MKHLKKLLFLIIIINLVGCNNNENNDKTSNNKDLLIGIVLIDNEELKELTANLSNETSKILGYFDKTKNEISFDLVDGYFVGIIPLDTSDYPTYAYSSEGFYDLIFDNTSASPEISANMYINKTFLSSNEKELISLYMSPVYMDDSYQIYSSITFEQMSYSDDLLKPKTYSLLQNQYQEEQDSILIDTRIIKINLIPEFSSETIEFTKILNDGSLQTIEFDSMNNTLTFDEDTNYIIVEKTNSLGVINYDIINKDAQNYQYYKDLEGNILYPITITILKDN